MELKHTETGDKRWVHGAWLILYLVLALFGRVQAGAELGDFGGFEDEPAHMVTSVMMREYATSFDPAHPIRFIEDYYLHYPKVASGHWPPVLHFTLGSIMIPLGVDRFSLLLGSCLVAALAAWSVRLLARQSMPMPLPGLLGLLFLALPMVQNLSAAPMTELLVAALGAIAVYWFSRYLKSGKASQARWFGIFAALAVLTKGNGVGLVLLPILAPMMTGRWNRMITRGTIFSGILVGIVGIGWYARFMGFSQTTWSASHEGLWRYGLDAAEFYSSEIFLILGSLTAGLACIGMVVGFLDRNSRDMTACLLAWLMGLYSCYLFIPTGIEARHLSATFPVWLVFAGRGALWLCRSLGWSPRVLGLPAAALVMLGIGLQGYAPTQSEHRGFRDAVELVLSHDTLDEAPWLIASDANGEGLAVAEAVLQDPGHERLQVLRSSKVLAEDDWLGNDYSMLYSNGEELGAFLRRVPVAVVFLDLSAWRKHWFPHHDLLQAYLENHPEHFEEIGRLDTIRDGVVHPKAMRIYRQIGFEDLPRNPIKLEEVLDLSPKN